MADDPNSLEGWFSRTPGNQAPKEALNNLNISEYLDYALRENGGPGYTKAFVNTLRGIRILGPGAQMAPIPDDTIGLLFVNRPMLNLSDENVFKHPQLHSLYRPPKDSLQAFIKGLLDPTWGKANSGMTDILDPFNPWISVLTNCCKVSSGFPDVTLNVSKSTPGIRKEVYQYVDGILKVNYDFDMRVSMYNPKKIMSSIFDVWNHYIEGVKLGDEGMQPYDQALLQNYRDYDCRFYHTVMNRNMRNIEGIYMTGYSWPNTYPSGAFSTIDRTQTSIRGQGQDELEINFPSVIFRYNNMEVADMFNRTTLTMNPNMHPQRRAQYYRKLEVVEYFAGQFAAYPWININTMEMEYWGRL